MTGQPYTLYGMPGSLYTAKARSYLRKQTIPFVERAAGHPAFREQILPKIGRWIIPVVVTPEGAVLQDGSAIIDHFEALGTMPQPAMVDAPCQQAVSYLFELFGGEGLLRPAMHYRWNFDDTNLAFLADDFVAGLAPGTDSEQADQFFSTASKRMRQATKLFGVTPASIPTVEAAYAEFLSLFNAHLKTAPYLLGGRPTLGDYGLIAPLYPHLGRDPYPATLMKQTAPAVWRWTERMNVPEQRAGDYLDCDEAVFADDDVPDTLKALMAYIAEEYLPEIDAHVAFANDWLAARPDLAAGTNGLDKPGERTIGMAAVPWRGTTIETGVMPYRFYLLQRLQDHFDACDDHGRARITAVFRETGLERMLHIRTKRPVERRDHLEVWGTPRS